jgi:RNA polymerase sigma factor for flagellar operon FliA
MGSPAETAYDEARRPDGLIRQLVTSHLGLVKRIVGRIRVGLQPSLSQDDLISAGTLGLVQAAHRFDPNRGVSFSTFAYRRIQGAVVDCLRRNDMLGKSSREQLALLRRCIQEFRARHGRRPRIQELAELAGMDEPDVLRYLSYEKWDNVGSLSQPARTEQGEASALEDLIAADAATPLERLEWQERLERLAAAIEELPERERQIIVMYYYEDLYMGEMAEILGVTEGRISQLHTRALYNLTRKLEGTP